MKVTIDPHSGFCWGVVRTIEIAEDELKNGDKLYSLGEIIHNPKETDRLKSKGLENIGIDELEKIAGSRTKVLIRAHGEPPSTYEKAHRLGIELIDATCPVVTKLQERIKRFYDQGYQVVIFGKKDHAEVIGLRGVTNDECIVVKNVAEALEQVDFKKSTVLFSQTTMDKPTFNEIKIALSNKIQNLVVETMEELAIEFHSKETICGQVSGRDKKLKVFAKENDVVIFVAGKQSSNGKVLFEICKESNPFTYFIEDVDELKEEYFRNAKAIGITGATSTPHWLMLKVKDFIENNYIEKELLVSHPN